MTIQHAVVRGVGLFLLSKVTFCYPNTRILTHSDPYSTYFAKMTVFYRNTSKTHKNTQEYEQIPSESTKFCESARIPQNTVRIPRRVGILRAFTQNTEAFRIPVKNSAQNRAEYAKEYRILHRIQNTAKNAVFYMHNTDVNRVWCVCATLQALPR